MQSPVSSISGISSAVNAVTSKKSGVAIALNGLFGETYGFDDVISTPLSTPSPLYRSLANNKVNSISPSKSLSVELSYNQQPVLLSDLADVTPYHSGGSGVLMDGNALCSFVSPYDNSRCTNSAVAKADGSKSFCQIHQKLAAKDLQVIQNNYSKTSSTNFSYTANVKKPPSKRLNSAASSAAQLLNSHHFSYSENNILNQANDLMRSSTSNGISVDGGQALLSFPHSVASNIAFPVSYVNAHSHQVNDTKKTHANFGHNVFRAVPLASAKTNEPGKTTAVQIKQGNVNTELNNTVLPMDRDVLQAFVDFLNQNHDRLTPKQQLNLLNSLGVTVATVKNPDDFTNIHQQPAISCHPSSNLVQKHISQANWTKNSAASNVPLQNQSNVSNALKRKTCFSKDSVSSSKKMKRTSTHSGSHSLQHLSTAELDERVLETIASIGGIPASKSSSQESSRRNKTKSSFQNAEWKSEASQPIPLPTVSISINQYKNEHLLKEKFSNASLKSYMISETNKELSSQNLFSLGPLCENDDVPVCTCSPSQQVAPVHSKTKHKPVKRTRIKQKPCSKCHHIDTQTSSINLFETILSASSKIQTELLNFKTKTGPVLQTLKEEHLPSDKHEDASTSSQLTDVGKSFILKRCRLSNKGTKLWKQLEKEENKAIRLLAKAAQTNVKECVKFVKSLGHRSTTYLQKRKKCGSTPSKCALTHRTGHRCSNSPLPLAFYCRDHVMHSNHQQLYKLGPNMNVIADIDPDPPLIKQRKKTKLPPLSKRKKRRTKRRNTLKEPDLNSNLLLQSEVSKSAETASKSSSTGQAKVKNLFQLSHSQPIMSDYVMDNNDDIMADSNTVQMQSFIDPPLSMKTNLLSDNLPSNAEEDSNSAMFEAFSFDGEELLHDVTPDMFSDLGLDNAFLLTGAVDSIDKLSFDELNDDESIFSNKANDQDTQADSSKNPPMDAVTQNSQSSVQSSINSSESLNVLPTKIETCQQSNLPAVSQQSIWPQKQEDNVIKSTFTPNSNGYEEPPPSLDTSFAEELNEIEGVLQSLENETFKSDTSLADSRSNWSVDDYKNNLKNEASLNVEQNKLASGRNYFETAASIQRGSVSSSSEVNAFSNPGLVKNSLPNQSRVNGSSASFDGNERTTSSDQVTFLSKLDDRKIFDAAKNNRSFKSTKKPKSKTSPRKRNDLASKTIFAPSNYLQFSSVSLADTKTSTKPASVVKMMQPQIISENVRSGKKAKSGVTSNSSNIAPHSNARMQPRLMSANVTGTGKTPNQSMILIPINAVRSANQVGLQSGNQNLGIAFAIPAQNMGGGNVSTMIPIRGSAFLTATSNNQQVLILGTAPTNNAVQLPANINQTLYQATNVASKSHPTPAVAKSVPLSTYNFNRTAKSPIMTAANSNVSVTAFPSSNISTTTASSSKQTNGTNQQPFKKQFSRDSIVIPPSPHDGFANKLHESLKAVSASIASISAAKPVRSKTTVDTSSSVHWSKTVTPVPPLRPQRKPSDGIGGQTSNMLYCRRINPSLNNNQHVIVGRLGSLAHMPRLAGKDDSKLTTKSSVQSKDSITEKHSAKHGGKPTAMTSLTGTDFLPLSPSINKTSTEVSRTNALWNGHTQSEPVISKSTFNDTSSSQLRDLSNQPLAINPDSIRESRHSFDTGSPVTINCVTSQPGSDIVSRHGSRKSDHSQMLKDPDFCESPPTNGVNSTKDLILTDSSFPLQASTQKINETVVSEVTIKDGRSALIGTKAPRRAAILRKR